MPHLTTRRQPGLRFLCGYFSAILLLGLLSLPVMAQSDPATAPATTSAPATAPQAAGAKSSVGLTPSDKLAVTAHTVILAQEPFHYTATAGYMPLKDEAGKLRANFFFVAYTKDQGAKEGVEGASTLPAATQSLSPASARPVTFLFNGGPGSASAWLHLGTAGPYRVPLTEDGKAPAPPYKLVANPFTWLTFSDLVFIDPVGTGYARAATPEQAKEFFNTPEDIASIAEFIRLYTTKYQRWDSPKFLAGESYGTTRAAALAEYLQDHTGLALNGIVLVSSVLNFQTLQPAESNDLPYALYLPSYTAAAWYHHKLPPDLQGQELPKVLAEVQAFALSTYTVALAQGTNLAPVERPALLAKLSRYTGLPADYIDQANLRIAPSRFQQALLQNDPAGAQMIGRFDARLTAYSADPLASRPAFDPSLSSVLPVYTATINSYLRQDLHYENDLPYEVLKGIPFDFKANNEYLYVGDNLRTAMQKNPHLKVFVASGYFDLATPFTATDYTVSHLNLPAPLRPNITQAYYRAGHMLYQDQASLQKLHADLTSFVKSALPAPATQP